MGKQVDLNSPLSAEDRKYLTDRGRGYLIHANERRFGTLDEPREPEEHEDIGNMALSPFYDSAERDRATYDVGGAPLPGSVLDYDSGRAYDRENGVTVEYSGPGHTPGAYDLQERMQELGEMEEGGFTSRDEFDGEDDIDQDIIDAVTEIKSTPTEKPLKDAIKAEGLEVPDEDEEETERGVTYRQQLENMLAVYLHDKRHGLLPADEELAEAE